MKYNFTNCIVEINAGTDAIKIDGMAGVTIQKIYEDYSLFMADLDGVKVGDRVRVPDFKVPAAEIDGSEKLNFDEIEVAGEYATVYKIEGEQISLVFDRALFQSAMDRNDTSLWEDTQLARYLRGPFFEALKKETSAAECGLLQKEDLWGDNALPFFKNGRNRDCFDKNEDCSVWYWTETPDNEDASAACFCVARCDGYAHYNSAGSAYGCIRPRFILNRKSRGFTPGSLENERSGKSTTALRAGN